MKQCPYCAESIQQEAIKCRYCGSRVSPLPGADGSGDWYRLSEGRMIAGVCAGLADMLGVPPTPIRLAMVLATLIGLGLAVPVYLVLWVLMPLREDRPQLNRRG